MTTDQIKQQITSAASAAGVDPNLALQVAQQESAFNPNVVSSAGAIGLFQLLPSTAAGLGVNPNDPTQNIQGGIAYLKQQLDTFGSVPLALAAYNAGPGNVTKYGGIPPFPETQNYVASILANLGTVAVGSPAPTDGTDYAAGSTDGTDYAGSDSSQPDPITITVGAICGLGLLWMLLR